MPLVDLKREEIEALGAFAQAFSTLAGETGDPKLAKARPLLDAGCSKFRSALEQPGSEIEDSLLTAHEFIESVTAWNGQPDSRIEALGAVDDALALLYLASPKETPSS